MHVCVGRKEGTMIWWPRIEMFVVCWGGFSWGGGGMCQRGGGGDVTEADRRRERERFGSWSVAGNKKSHWPVVCWGSSINYTTNLVVACVCFDEEEEKGAQKPYAKLDTPIQRGGKSVCVLQKRTM